MPEHEQYGEEQVPLAQVYGGPQTPPPPPPMAGRYGVPEYMSGGMGAYAGKPGIITAMGVISIVVASLTLIACGVETVVALYQTAVVQAARMGTQIRRTQAAAAVAQAAAAQATPPGPTGLGAAERQTAINVLASRQSLSIPRQAQLDELLAQGGQTIFNIESGQLTSEFVRGAVQSSSRRRSARPKEAGSDYFVTATGAIELYDGNGVFRPTDRSQPTLRVAADVNHYMMLLNGPPDSSDGPTTLNTSAQSSVGWPGASGASGAATGSTPVTPNFDFGAVGVVTSAAGLSFVLGIYLLVIGILTLRGTGAGGKLHLIYALIKLPLIALGVYGWWRLQENYYSIMAALGGSGTPVRGMGSGPWLGGGPMGFAVLAALYPLALLVVLWLKPVREYFGKAA